MKIFRIMFVFHHRLPHGDSHVISLSFGLTLPEQQLLVFNFKNTEMTSVEDIKPRIPKILYSQTEDEHTEYFSGA